jgi:hypothetical protein
MNSLIQLKTLGSRGRNPAPSLPLRRGFLLIHLILVCFAFAPQMRAASCHQVVHGGGNLAPPPKGGYCNFTTAEGTSALFHLNDGLGNTALGWSSLFNNTTASFNTGVGAGTLLFNTGDNNTATGALALLNNTTGANNTAVGAAALQNSTGEFNIALGANAGTDPDIVSNNVYIGDPGFPGDENVISIGGIAASGTPYENTYIGGIFGASVTAGVALPVYVDEDGHLGTNPVNASGQKVRIRTPQGAQPQARFNHKVDKLEATATQQQEQIADQQKQISQQQRQIEILMAQLKEQAAQIQKVSAELEASKPAPQMVNNP